METLVLVDKLGDLVHNARGVPLTDQVRIDRQEITDILDQMRATLPTEVMPTSARARPGPEELAAAKRRCDRLFTALRQLGLGGAADTLLASLAEELDALVTD